MKARTLEEMAAALALIRPGAAEYGSKELFLKRLRGKEPVAYPHESLKSILGDTLGVCIYQEQVMQIAQAVGATCLWRRRTLCGGPRRNFPGSESASGCAENS